MKSLIKQISELTSEITERQEKLDALNKQREMIDGMVPQAIADYIHSIKCNANHIDQCGYEYEKWENNDKFGAYSAKREYYKKAETLIKKANEIGLPVSAVIDILEII